MAYWLLKSEPATFGIDDLRQKPAATSSWDGVRNFQARNYLKAMRSGDEAFFYHSSCAEPGIVGIARIVREAYPDHTAFDVGGAHYDARSTPAAPRWFMVDVRFVRKFARTLTLTELRPNSALADLALVRKGNRLSVMPVSAAQWQAVLALDRRH